MDHDSQVAALAKLRRSVRHRVLSKLFYIIFPILIIGFTPIGISQKSLNNDCLSSVDQRKVYEREGIAEYSEIEVQNIGSGQVALSSFALSWPEVFAGHLIQESPINGGTDSAPLFVLQRDEKVKISGVINELRFLVTGEPDSQIRVKQNGRQFTKNVQGSIEMTLLSSQFNCVVYQPFIYRSFENEVKSSTNLQGQVFAGSQIRQIVNPDDLSRKSILGLALLNFGKAVLIFVGATLLLVLCLLFFFSTGRKPGLSSRDLLTGCMSSLFFLILTIGSLSYIFPVKDLVRFLLFPIMLLALVRLKRNGFQLADVKQIFGFMKVFPVMLLSFLPVFYFGTRYAGQYKTDLFENLRLISIVRNHSLIEMQRLPEAISAGGLTSGAGFSWRTLDSIGAAVVSEVLNVSSNGGYLILGIIAFLSFSFSVVNLSLSTQRVILSQSLGVTLLFSPFLIGLFIENYFAQYLFVAFAPAVLLSISNFVELQKNSEHLLKSRLFQMLICVAFAFCLYPYFAVALYGPVVAYALFNNRSSEGILKRMVFCGLGFVGLSNFNLIPVFNFRAGLEFVPFLNALTKNILLAPYSGEKLVRLVLGFEPYQLRNWMQLEIDGSSDLIHLLKKYHTVLSSAMPLLYLVTAFALLYVFRSMFANDTDGKIIKLALFGWISYVVVLSMNNSTYAEMKAVWTLLALLPLVLTQTVKRFSSRILFIILVPLSLAWFGTTFSDFSSWFVSPNSKTTSGYHSTASRDLEQVSNLIRNSNDRILIIGGDEPLRDSDRDRVLTQHILVSIEDLDKQFLIVDQKSDLLAMSLKNVIIISIGRSNLAQYGELGVMYDGSYLQVYKEK